MEKTSIEKIALLALVAVLVVFAIRYSSRVRDRNTYTAEVAERLKNNIQLLKITKDDHILGSRDAHIFLIEYADVNCPYCRSLHPKLKQLVADKNKEVKVAWVYRHFPLAISAGKIDPEERALECAWKERGDPGFFSYLERLVSSAIERINFTDEQLLSFAKQENLNSDGFNDCLTSNRFDGRVTRDHQVGAIVGVSRIPHSFLLTHDGMLQQLVGDKPLSVYQGIIDLLQKPSLQPNN